MRRRCFPSVIFLFCRRIIPIGLIACILPFPVLLPSIPICMIQGSGFSSYFQGWTVQVEGIVIADFDQTGQRGFYIQTPDCDSNGSTSDGIFVYLGERIETVSLADRVEVSGLVQEYYGMTEIVASAASVNVLSHHHPLPAAQELNPPFSNQSARSYFESLEAMYVQLGEGRVVGPTDSDDRTWLVRADLGVERVFHNDPAGTGELICADDGGAFEIVPEAKVGDLARGITGVLDFRIGTYCIQLTSAPLLESGLEEAFGLDDLSNQSLITMATFNLHNLFDMVDDPLTDDEVLGYTEYQRRLQKRALVIGDELAHPALLAVQEVENANVLADLVARPEIQAAYQFLHQEGPDLRGIDVALLYRPDLITILVEQSRQQCTALVDGFEPDGNGDPENPQHTPTCDLNNDGILDGSRLFSRPPLVVHLLARPSNNGSGASIDSIGENFYDFWLILCHFKSKVGDSSTVEYTLPRRIEQAEFVAGLVQEIRLLSPDAGIMILGDLNDHPEAQPLRTLLSSGLANSFDLAAYQTRYTYIYQGISQTLDYILFTPQINLIPFFIQPIHINADYPYVYTGQSDSVYRSSDHDPLLVAFAPAVSTAFLPLILR